jgi:SAM-dependent methyltransferase
MNPAPIQPLIAPDWNEIWKARQCLHESSKQFDDPSHNWDKRENAERYDSSSRSEYDQRVKTTIASLTVNRNSRVLDIGAGPGTLTIPLSPLVKEITAVEPGAGMVEILMKHAERENLHNITCVQKTWEEIDLSSDLSPPFDIVIASLSLTMHDIREALRKMDAASCGSVDLFWFVDMPFWERMYADLWETLHGSPYHAGPKADCLFGVLYQMGIYPDVTMLPLAKEYRFGSQEEMLGFFRRRFGAKTTAEETVVNEYVTPMMRTEGNTVVISGNSTFAHVRWRTTKS